MIELETPRHLLPRLEARVERWFAGTSVRYDSLVQRRADGERVLWETCALGYARRALYCHRRVADVLERFGVEAQAVEILRREDADVSAVDMVCALAIIDAGHDVYNVWMRVMLDMTDGSFPADCLNSFAHALDGDETLNVHSIENAVRSCNALAHRDARSRLYEWARGRNGYPSSLVQAIERECLDARTWY